MRHVGRVFGRRAALGLALGGVAVMGLAGTRPARADDPAAAGPITTFNAALLAGMKAGKATPFPSRYQALAPVVGQAFDLQEILSASVGPRWEKLSAEDQAALLDVFTRFTVATYVANFDTYSGQRIDVLPQQRMAGSDVIVSTQIVRPTGAPVRVDYVMRQESGGWKAVDVLLDGSISRVAVQRSDFRQLMKNDDPAELIASLKKKIAALSGGTLTS